MCWRLIVQVGKLLFNLLDTITERWQKTVVQVWFVFSLN